MPGVSCMSRNAVALIDTLTTSDHTSVQLRSYWLGRAEIGPSSGGGVNTGRHEKVRFVVHAAGWLRTMVLHGHPCCPWSRLATHHDAPRTPLLSMQPVGYTPWSSTDAPLFHAAGWLHTMELHGRPCCPCSRLATHHRAPRTPLLSMQPVGYTPSSSTDAPVVHAAGWLHIMMLHGRPCCPFSRLATHNGAPRTLWLWGLVEATPVNSYS